MTNLLLKKLGAFLLVTVSLAACATPTTTRDQNTTPDQETPSTSNGDATVPTNGDTTPPTDTPTETPEEKVIEISAKNFAFSPTSITVGRGDRVKIVLTVEEGMHDWRVDEFNAGTDVIQAGETSETAFIANTAGTFEYYCGVGNHRAMGMVGQLIVQDRPNSQALFNKDVDSLVTSREVTSGTASGLFAAPREAGEYPGVVMIHEWWGLNDNIEYMAKLLASEGYNVFAVDLYDGTVAATPEEAGTLSTQVRENPDAARQKMQDAVAYLKEQANSTKVASLGWCFGGGQSLNLSLSEPLDATVIYYGQLTDDQTQLRNIDSPVLGIFGDQDQSISVDSVRSFETALNDLNIPNDITIYPGVGHAFANPSNSNYAEEETRDAWGKTLAFLASNLK